MTIDQETLKAYLADAAANFSRPTDVLEHPQLDREQKRRILESWKVDEQELATATGENMGRDDGNILSQVVAALNTLES